MISLWSGKVDELQSTTINNWSYINDLITNFNKSISKNLLLVSIDDDLLDLTQYNALNRDYRNTFISNAKRVNQIVKAFYQQFNQPIFKTDTSFKLVIPTIPEVLYFDKTLINNYWSALQTDFNYINNVITDNHLC